MMPPERETETTMLTMTMRSVMSAMTKWPTVTHWPEGKGEHALPKTHLAQTFFIASDLDTEPVLGLDNPNLVNYVLSH